MKKIILFPLLIFPSIILFAETPLSGKYYENSVRVGNYTSSNMSIIFCETDGYALVSGERVHYYLYNTLKYAQNVDLTFWQRCIFEWAESLGFVIDYDNAGSFAPNPGLATSVISLMKTRDADISVTIYNSSGNFYLYMNIYMEDEGHYVTIVFPLVK